MIAEQTNWADIAHTEISPRTPISKPYRHVLRHGVAWGGGNEYVVHTQTIDDKAYHSGHYTESILNAVSILNRRAKRDGLRIK